MEKQQNTCRWKQFHMYMYACLKDVVLGNFGSFKSGIMSSLCGTVWSVVSSFYRVMVRSWCESYSVLLRNMLRL